MDFITILNYVRDYVPVPVIVAVVAVIMLVYGSLYIADLIEKSVEERFQKELKIFDHKKIWLSVFWCVVVSVALAIGKFIAWKEVCFYCLVILGASTFLYEAILKKVIKKND